MEKNNNINEQLKNLKAHFPFLEDDVLYALLMMGIYFVGNKIPFMLVGSIAWKALGLPMNRKVKDIDMEIICEDEEVLETLRNICREQNTNLHDIKEEQISHFDNKPFVFYAFGVEFNIWVSKKQFYHQRHLSCGGILIPTVDEIIGIKNKYHRPKDLDDLFFLSKDILSNICGKENIDKFISKINISEIENIIMEKE